jgi:hypothetical protein
VAYDVRVMTLPRRRRIVVVVFLTALLFVAAGLIVASKERTNTQLGQARNGERGGLSVANTPTSWPFLLALAGPAVAAVAILSTNRREADRLKHERQMKLREERQRAYSVFFSLARDARAAIERPPRPEAQTGERTALQNLRDAHATVELVGETQALRDAAGELYDVCKQFLEGQRPSEADRATYRRARRAFLECARTETVDE